MPRPRPPSNGDLANGHLPSGAITAAAAPNPSDDICPVCKSNRYLNPNLQFLINPECYHKMCSTCVDRIFTSGPASCPVPYCGKTLRKKGFHKAFFGDLGVEREVDIRKRVAATFNRRQEEFQTLLDWNNYLEEVESLVFDLVEGSREEKLQAEERLRAYRESNMGEIEDNRKAGLEEADLARRRDKAEKEAARQRRLAAYREVEEEKAMAEKNRRYVLDRLATTDEDPTQITQLAHQKVILKRATGKKNLTDAQPSNGVSRGAGFPIRGLKPKEAHVQEKPYDPFGGVDLVPSRFVLQDNYDSEWLENAKHDTRHMAGGYSLHEYYARTMYEAFSGLGVFIENEVADRGRRASSVEGTAAAVLAGGAMINLKSKMDLDDVF